MQQATPLIDASGKEVYQAYVTPVDGKWTTNSETAELPVGKYTAKATIVDVAGNPFEQASKSIEVTTGQLLAVADQTYVSEDTFGEKWRDVRSRVVEAETPTSRLDGATC